MNFWVKKKINEYKNLEIFRHKVAKVFSKNTQTHTEKKITVKEIKTEKKRERYKSNLKKYLQN